MTATLDTLATRRAAAYDGIYAGATVKPVTIESFERWARFVLDVPPGESGHPNGNEIALALRRFGVDQLQGKRVLDYCCGVGRTSVYFALRGASVSAFDASPKAIEVARRTAEASGVADRVRYGVMPAQALEYEDNAFDAAYCQSALHILVDYPDFELAARELARVLKPGARAVFSEEPLGHNPLLAPVRLWRRRRYSDCGGRTLRYADIRAFGRPFARATMHHFNLLSQVKSIMRARSVRGAQRVLLRGMQRCDAWLLDNVPALRPLAGKVVIEFEKAEAPG